MKKMKKTMALLLSYVLVLAILPLGTLVEVVKGATEIPQYLNYGGTYFLSSTLYKDKVVFVDEVRKENPNYGNKDSYGNYDYSKYIYQDILKLIDNGEEKEILELDNYVSSNLNRLGEKAYFNISYSVEEKLIYNFETGKVEKINEKVLNKNEILGMLNEKLGITYEEDNINFYSYVEEIFDNKGNRVKNYQVQIVKNGSYNSDIYNIIENKNGEYFVHKSNTFSNYYSYNNGLIYKYDYNYDNKGGNNLVSIIDKAEVIGEYPVVGQDINQWGNKVIGNKLYAYDYEKIFEYELQNDKFVSSNVYDIYGNSATIDSNNNIWALIDENGKRFVVKIKNGELKKMYEVSPVMDRLYVYDDNNLLVTSAYGYTHITKKSVSDDNNGGNDNTTEDKNEVVVKPEVNETVDNTTKVEVGTLTPGATNVIEATVGNNVDKVEVTLTDIETIKNDKGAVNLKLNNGNKINLPFSILSDEMLEGAKEVKFEFAAKEDKKITGGLKAVNKVFSFELLVTKEDGQVSVHNFADGAAEITLALSDEDLKGLDRSKLVVLYYNEETKKYEEMETVVDGNNVTFKTTHFSKFVVAEKEVTSEDDDNVNDEETTTKPESDKNTTVNGGTTSNGTTNSGTTGNGTNNGTTNKKPNNTVNKLTQTGSAASTSVLSLLGLVLSTAGVALFIRKK